MLAEEFWLRKEEVFMSLSGKIIVIEGTDGSGKQTQSAKLKERLIKECYNVYSTSFPNYNSDSSAAVKMYLNGEIRSSASDISAKAASIFYATDRYITFKKEIEPVYEKQESVIVFDRWSSSNIVHQGAKLVAEIDDEKEREEKLQEFIKWLDCLEHEDFNVPRADTVIYLNVPLDYTIALREKRANKITGGEKQDIHESDNDHLRNASQAGLLAAKLLGWKVIECVKDGKMRSIEDIASELWAAIN